MDRSMTSETDVQPTANTLPYAVNGAADGAEPQGAERRRYRRAPMKLGARFMLDDGTEHQGSVIDVSMGGISFAAKVQPPMGSGIIAYVEELGRVEGTVIRGHSVGFAILLALTPHKRERLEEKLSWRLNGAAKASIEARRHERESMSKATMLTRSDGSEMPCKVMDMSLGGVSLETAEWPPIGEEVMVGKMRGRVVRHHETGVGIQFIGVPPSRGSLAQQLVSAA
jgi:hypothetical protein